MSDFGDDIGEVLLRTTTRESGMVLREIIRATYRHATKNDHDRTPREKHDKSERIDSFEASAVGAKDLRLPDGSKQAVFDFKLYTKIDPRGTILLDPIRRAGIQHAVSYEGDIMHVATLQEAAPTLLNLADAYTYSGKLKPSRFPNYDEYAAAYAIKGEDGRWLLREDATRTAPDPNTKVYSAVQVPDEKVQRTLSDTLVNNGVVAKPFTNMEGEHLVIFDEGALKRRFPTENDFDAWLKSGGLTEVEAFENQALEAEMTHVQATDDVKKKVEDELDKPAQEKSPVSRREAARLEQQAHLINKDVKIDPRTPKITR